MTVPNALKGALDDGFSLLRPFGASLRTSRCSRAGDRSHKREYTTSSWSKHNAQLTLPHGTFRRLKAPKARPHLHLSTIGPTNSRYNSTADDTDAIGTPYAELTVGIPKETYPNERRVAATPQNVALLIKKGFRRVLVERDAGRLAKFPDDDFSKAGGTLVGPGTLWAESDILLKVRAPSLTGNNEVARLKEGAVVISFLHPSQNKELVDALASRGATSFAMDMIPRISRAQVFDALSSMANIAGYKAVLEASNHYGRFLTGQSTAAGRVPASRVLVIGAGVAGLSAIATARRLGAIVRGFDTRSAAREQVQSLGADFLEVNIQEDGSGAGGYGKEMSKEFVEAEMKLFMQQCREVDIVITTAMIPGRRAPILIDKAMVAAMKPGSVIVDMAAEAGGNCELTAPGESYISEEGVTIIGYTDLPSRLPTQSSTLYSNNITKFMLSISTGEKTFGVNLEDEVVRGSIVTNKGKILAPAPRPTPPAAQPKPPAPAVEEVKALTPWQKTVREVSVVAGGMGGILALGKFTSPLFMSNIFTAGLAGLVGYRVVWGVAPALHSPLMSVTNAISGMVGIGGFVSTNNFFGRVPAEYLLVHHGRGLSSRNNTASPRRPVGTSSVC
jgi:NAD(P) transhydrogenase